MAHSLVGATLAAVAPQKIKTPMFWGIMAFLPIVPDFDYVGYVLRIPYASPWGHRGFTHSFLFCLVLAWFHTKFTRKTSGFLLPLIFYFVAASSHPILDAFTNGGLGVAFFAPYNWIRYFFPWRPIEVSPLGLGFFSEKGLVVIFSELYWIGIPCLSMMSGVFLLRRWQGKV